MTWIKSAKWNSLHFLFSMIANVSDSINHHCCGQLNKKLNHFLAPRLIYISSTCLGGWLITFNAHYLWLHYYLQIMRQYYLKVIYPHLSVMVMMIKRKTIRQLQRIKWTPIEKWQRYLFQRTTWMIFWSVRYLTSITSAETEVR